MDRQDLIKRLSVFLENETRSCSMDFGGITPLYVYRMWNGSVPLEKIERKKGLERTGPLRMWKELH